MKLYFIILAILVALIAQIVLSYFVMDWFFNHYRNQDSTELVEDGQPGKTKDKGKDGEGDAEKEYEFGTIIPVDDLVINPSDASGRRIFKITLAVECDPENTDLQGELGTRMPFIRDKLISYLSSLPETQLSDISQREAIRDSVTVVINGFLNAGAVDRVLFQDFIRQ